MAVSGVKRKAMSQKVKPTKVSSEAILAVNELSVKKPARSPSPAPAATPSIYDDPMIDPIHSGSDDDLSGSEDAGDELDEDENAARDGEDEDIEPAQPIAGPSKPSSSKNLYRPPTLADVDLIASSSSFSTSSSTFTLQINALLAEATPKSGSLSPVESLVVLWKKWAKKRGLPKDRGRDAHLARTVAAWVLQGGEVGGVGGERLKTRRVNGMGRGMGGWELLRAGWNFIASNDFDKSPVFVTPPKDKKDRKVARVPGDCLLDSSGSINVFAAWTRGDVELLQHHARETLAVLEDSSVDRFADVFLKDYSLAPSNFDEYAHIHVDVESVSLAAIDKVLRRGFTDRIKRLIVRPVSADTLSIGLIFDSALATRVLDIGPPTEKTEETAAFRELWGDLAELRRFKDGNIAETVVWSITRPEDATQIPSRIVKHLLERHFKIPSDNVTSITSDATWSTIVQVPSSARESVSTAGAEKLGFRPIMDAYDELYKVLKNVDDELPLAILTVQPASELLRFSSIFVPHPVDSNRYPSAPDCLKYVPSADIILQFESSPRWPDDLAAIQKVKLAMFEKLATVIAAHKKGTKVNIALEQGRSEIEDQASLEVFTAGVGFRVRIYHDRERTLLERIINGETQTFGTALPQPPLRLAVPALELHVRRFIWSTRHHSGIAPMHHRYPSYSSATRLLKRWISAHMLSLLISREVIELIMAKVYLDPGSLATPSSAVTGFLRAMDLLAGWDWRAEPLFSPLYSLNSTDGVKRIRFPEDARAEASKAFEQRRKKLEAVGNAAKAGWRVITEEDLEGGRYCEDVTGVIASRVRALAKGTLENVKQLEDLDVAALFATPTQDYDVLIHLNPELSTRYAQGSNADKDVWEAKTRYRNVQGGGLFGEGVKLGLDLAASFARDVQRLYGDAVLVFFDEHGGSTIGLLWNPAKATARAMKPFLGYTVKPAQSEAALVEIDKESLLAEVARMGKGLIQKIQIK